MGTPSAGAASDRRIAAASQYGFSAVEVLTVLALGAVILVISLPSLHDAVKREQGRATAMEARSHVRMAYIKALKEKVEHRVVFHDESSGSPNTIELQVDQGGTFVTIPDQVYDAPQGVRILGSGSTDSIDSLTADSRGRCDAGTLYVRSRDGAVFTLTIDSQCHTSM